jgi:hypothetical protein
MVDSFPAQLQYLFWALMGQGLPLICPDSNEFFMQMSDVFYDADLSASDVVALMKWCIQSQPGVANWQQEKISVANKFVNLYEDLKRRIEETQ